MATWIGVGEKIYLFWICSYFCTYLAINGFLMNNSIYSLFCQSPYIIYSIGRRNFVHFVLAYFCKWYYMLFMYCILELISISSTKAMPCTEYNIDFLQCRFILINEIILSYFSVHLLSILKRGIGHSISSLMSAVLPD